MHQRQTWFRLITVLLGLLGFAGCSSQPSRSTVSNSDVWSGTTSPAKASLPSLPPKNTPALVQLDDDPRKQGLEFARNGVMEDPPRAAEVPTAKILRRPRGDAPAVATTVPAPALSPPTAVAAVSTVAPAKDYAAAIQAILKDLETVDPARVDEFITATRQAATADSLEQVLAAWRTTVDYRKQKLATAGQASSPPATVPPPATLPAPVKTVVSGKPTNEVTVLKAHLNPPVANALPPVVPALPTSKPEPPKSPALVAKTLGSDDGQVEEQEAEVVTLANAIGPIDRSTKLPGPGAILEPSIAQKAIPLTNEREEKQRLIRTLAHLMRSVEVGKGKSASAWLRQQAQARVFYLFAGDRENAFRPLEGMDAADNRFWQGLLGALAEYLELRDSAPASDRTAQTLAALEGATAALADKADLDASVPVFCREVLNFGNYSEFEHYDFRAGQTVVVYWEVRRFASRETKEGYRTSIHSSFVVQDSTGAVRHRSEHPFQDDLCRNRRHDYFNVVAFDLPKDLPVGVYTLKVKTVDKLSQKVTERERRFTIR